MPDMTDDQAAARLCAGLDARGQVGDRLDCPAGSLMTELQREALQAALRRVCMLRTRWLQREGDNVYDLDLLNEVILKLNQVLERETNWPRPRR